MVSIKQQGRSDVPFDALYHNHHSWLRRWLSAKLGCSHTAADLAHDTYLRILARGTTPAPEQSRRFLTQVAKGLVVDHYRRRRIETPIWKLSACFQRRTRLLLRSKHSLSKRWSRSIRCSMSFPTSLAGLFLCAAWTARVIKTSPMH